MKGQFYKEKRHKLLEKVKDNSVIVLFAGNAPKKTADEAYPFTPNRNFYYLTGVEEPDHILLMSKINGEEKSILFIKDIDLELEIYSINTPALARLQGAVIDANGGYIIKKDNKSSKCAVSLVRTDNFGNREFITYYNCLVTLNTLDAETTGENVNVQAYKLSVKCLGDNGNMQYFVREEDLPGGSNFIDNFYNRVYIPS